MSEELAMKGLPVYPGVVNSATIGGLGVSDWVGISRGTNSPGAGNLEVDQWRRKCRPLPLVLVLGLVGDGRRRRAPARGDGVVDVVVGGASRDAATPPPPVLVLRLQLQAMGDGHGWHGSAGCDG